eukprot:CAMPEP_0117789336 /NCGR_PEP_ID=MMETSP0948-20121206/7581_1 /TAXON_ID=44440 /ORGANISM="Chattonella subsalsa, Strain CCMP2191" /LENGTH=146 /DNA_ID=CAMNT_0005618939 /DNA_START=964 /DNA_END=1407 /DNA_ORIENTATION=+
MSARPALPSQYWLSSSASQTRDEKREEKHDELCGISLEWRSRKNPIDNRQEQDHLASECLEEIGGRIEHDASVESTGEAVALVDPTSKEPELDGPHVPPEYLLDAPLHRVRLVHAPSQLLPGLCHKHTPPTLMEKTNGSMGVFDED